MHNNFRCMDGNYDIYIYLYIYTLIQCMQFKSNIEPPLLLTWEKNNTKQGKEKEIKM